MKLEGPEKNWWTDLELGLLRDYDFPGHVTVLDGSVGPGYMGVGFTWMDRSLERCNSERIGRDEEGTSSGRVDLGGYAVILKNTPDTQDLVTVTDSEVMCFLVSRWIGQRGESSLVNTADADILEFIISKLRTRITSKTRTFLVKIKSHRDPLNEWMDDLEDEGNTLEKEGEIYQWKDRTTRLVYSYYDRTTHQWKKDTWSEAIRNVVRKGTAEFLMEDRLQ